MFEVKKQISIDINIDQDGLEQLITEEIHRRDSSIKVKAIKFIQRRNPTALEVEVEASMDGYECKPKELLPKSEEKAETSQKEKEVSETQPEPAAEAQAEPTPEVQEKEEPKAQADKAEAKPAKKTMKSLFDN